MKVQPYLFFEGRCDEALAFYAKAIGATVNRVMRYRDNPEPAQGQGAAMPPDKVMHADLTIGESTVLCSDGMCSGQPDFKGVSLTITAADEAEAEKLFAALADGGQVHMPLTRTFFSPRFGMLVDRFGLGWMVIAEG